MAKYGIGARVKDPSGDIATIDGKRKGERHLHWDDQEMFSDCWFSKSELTPVSPCAEVCEVAYSAPVWKPKVGDKMRWLGKTSATMLTKGSVYEIVKDDGGRAWNFGITDDEQSTGNHTTGPAWLIENFEPVVVEPALTIEAGKFYRTRDGRRVGPAIISHEVDIATFGTGGHMSAVCVDNGRQSARDDTTTERSGDIVAEWVDPKPEPKFKKGDRVICVDNAGASAAVVGAVYIAANDASDDNCILCVDGEDWGMLAFRFTPAPTDFQVGDVVRQTDKDPGKSSIWDNSVVERVNGTIWPISARNSSGHVGAFGAELLELVRRPPVSAAAADQPIPSASVGLAIGDDVVLSAPARITGFDKRNARVVLHSGGSFVLPISALTAA